MKVGTCILTTAIVTAAFGLRPAFQRTSSFGFANAQITEPRDAELIRIAAGTAQIGDEDGPPGERPAFQFASQPA